MDIALIIGVVLGMGAMIGSIAFELSKGAAGSFGILFLLLVLVLLQAE